MVLLGKFRPNFGMLGSIGAGSFGAGWIGYGIAYQLDRVAIDKEKKRFFADVKQIQETVVEDESYRLFRKSAHGADVPVDEVQLVCHRLEWSG